VIYHQCMSRFQKLLIAAIVVLVLVVGVGVGVLVKQQADAAAYRDFLICMELHGSTPSDPGTPEQALQAAEACDD
jgi:hypothetical protein